MAHPTRGKIAAARLMRLARRLIAYDPGPPRTPAELTRAAAFVGWLARLFYLFAAYYIFNYLPTFANSIIDRPLNSPLWPVALLVNAFGGGWVEHAPLIFICAVPLALVAALLPSAFALRFAVFLSVFGMAAVQNSHGAINHVHYIVVFTSFALLFLPPRVSPRISWDCRPSRADALAIIRVFWLTQALALLPYTLSGYWKIRHSGLELFSGDAMARLLLDRIANQAADIPPLLPLVVSNGYIAQALLLGAVYMQIFALFALFRPHLHRPIGIGLILFHFGTGWLLAIPFDAHIIVNGLFLVFSPLAPKRFWALEFARSLPLLGEPLRAGAWAARRVRRRARREKGDV